MIVQVSKKQSRSFSGFDRPDNFPNPPMPVTMILSAREEEDDNFVSAAIVYQDICAYLNSETFKYCELNFEEFLSNLNLDFEKIYTCTPFIHETR